MRTLRSPGLKPPIWISAPRSGYRRWPPAACAELETLVTDAELLKLDDFNEPEGQ
jgi:hypothetical protein